MMAINKSAWFPGGAGQSLSKVLATTSIMELTNGRSFDKLFQAHTLVLNQSLSIAGLMSLNCAVELGIADLIHSHGGPMPLSELARSIPIPPEKAPSLRRLMRLLASHGVFAAEPDGNSESETAYLLTPFSELLLTKGTNLSAFIRVNSDPAFMKPWFHMGDWFKRKGSTPFEVAYDGKCVWDLTKQRPELNDMFNDAMSCETCWVVKAMVTEFPQFFRGLKSLVDVGGGTGASARMVAEAFPDVKCTVFDLPHVVATLPESKLVNAVGGSMFDSIPPADAIFLKMPKLWISSL
ncbi:trans-resveratrol di-O-methyltransferase-like isoform X2 [Phoenix dactylifera]|uniref:Trans-resveratrol di-O-methyltransferase-like isoform X2 n=1 Tax=Phoenix dactylifera TaxID=42345 RepID=A0A8B9AEX7_PHODC|nr:trans-resveratrol di-O-methyltransferase-like isoform X2 [Phoenix dactylifera]